MLPRPVRPIMRPYREVHVPATRETHRVPRVPPCMHEPPRKNVSAIHDPDRDAAVLAPMAGTSSDVLREEPVERANLDLHRTPPSPRPTCQTSPATPNAPRIAATPSNATCPAPSPHSRGSRRALGSTDPLEPTSRDPHRASHDAQKPSRQRTARTVMARRRISVQPPHVRRNQLLRRRVQALAAIEPRPQRVVLHPHVLGPRNDVVELQAVPLVDVALPAIRTTNTTRLTAIAVELVVLAVHEASSLTPANQRHVSHSPFPLHVQARVCHVA